MTLGLVVPVSSCPLGVCCTQAGSGIRGESSSFLGKNPSELLAWHKVKHDLHSAGIRVGILLVRALVEAASSVHVLRRDAGPPVLWHGSLHSDLLVVFQREIVLGDLADVALDLFAGVQVAFTGNSLHPLIVGWHGVVGRGRRNVRVRNFSLLRRIRLIGHLNRLQSAEIEDWLAVGRDRFHVVAHGPMVAIRAIVVVDVDMAMLAPGDDRPVLRSRTTERETDLEGLVGVLVEGEGSLHDFTASMAVHSDAGALWGGENRVELALTGVGAAVVQGVIAPGVDVDPDLLGNRGYYSDGDELTVIAAAVLGLLKVRIAPVVAVGPVVDLEMVVHLHPFSVVIGVDSGEAHLELLHGHVNITIIFILGIGHLSDKLLGPELALSAIVAAIAVSAPRVTGLDQLVAIRQPLEAGHSVGVAQDHAPLVCILVTASMGSRRDEIAITEMLGYEFPNLIDSHVLSLSGDDRATTEVADALRGQATRNVVVVAAHLSKGLLQNYGPNRAIIGHSGAHRQIINEWDVVIDDNRAWDAEGEHVDGVATFGIELRGKDFLHAAWVLSNSGSGCKEPTVADATLLDVCWADILGTEHGAVRVLL